MVADSDTTRGRIPGAARVTEFLRLDRRGYLSTPVLTYTHPHTLRQITVVATTQFGTAGYYRELRSCINDRESIGAVVHRSGPLPLTEALDATTTEQHLLDGLRRLRSLEAARMGQAFGWVPREPGLACPDRWLAHDLTELAIVRLLGTSTVAAGLRRDVRRYSRRVERIRMTTTAELRALAHHPQRPRSGFRAQVASARAAVAVKAACPLSEQQAATAGDRVLVWGAECGPALEPALLAHGFWRTGADWYTALQLPAPAPAIWRLVRNSYPTRVGTASDTERTWS